MELADSIANSLIRTVHSLAKNWPGVIAVADGIEVELRQTAMMEPTNSVEFLRFLLSSRQSIPENLLTATLPAHLRVSVTELLERRYELRIRKEELVAAGSIEQAADCRDRQQKLTDEISSQLAGQKLAVTIGCVTEAIEHLGWPPKTP